MGGGRQLLCEVLSTACDRLRLAKQQKLYFLPPFSLSVVSSVLESAQIICKAVLC